jgi:hypothetical protein
MSGIGSGEVEIHAMQASVFIDFWIKSMRIHKPDAKEDDLLAAFRNAVQQKINQLSLRKGYAVTDEVGAAGVDFDEWTKQSTIQEGDDKSPGSSVSEKSEMKSDTAEFGTTPGSCVEISSQGIYMPDSVADADPSEISGVSGDEDTSAQMELDLDGCWKETLELIYGQDREEKKEDWMDEFV